jgi:predicted kinase
VESEVAPLLVVFGGLPGTGKTTVSRTVAARVGAAFVRVDELEVAMWRSGIAREQPTGLAAYAVAEAVVESCLGVGASAVVDAVNPVEPARRAWRDLARRTGAMLRVVEVVCSDPVEHRRRVERREADIDGQRMPSWREVTEREYEPWSEDRLVLDTSRRDVDHAGAVEEYLARARD